MNVFPMKVGQVLGSFLRKYMRLKKAQALVKILSKDNKATGKRRML